MFKITLQVLQLRSFLCAEVMQGLLKPLQIFILPGLEKSNLTAPPPKKKQFYLTAVTIFEQQFKFFF